MTATSGTQHRSGRSGRPSKGLIRFELRAVLGLFAIIVGAVPFLTLTVLLKRSWGPLQSLDDRVAEDLNEVVSGSPALVDALRAVTDLGGNGAAVYGFTLATAALLIRRQRRLAAYVLTTGVGLALLVPATKAAIGRPRPQVPFPVVDIPTNASFPSGHAMVSIVVWTVLALVLMPALRPRARPWLLAAALAVAAAVGATRLVLGVHFLSDVVAGWALGAGWLAVTTAAFRGWQHDQGQPTLPLTQGLDPKAPAPWSQERRPDRLPPKGTATAARLATAALAILAAMSAVGILVTGPLVDTALGRFDTAVVAAFVELRTEARTEALKAVGSLASTRVVIAVALAELVLFRAATRSWRPAVFIVAAVAGEALLYFATSRIVSRSRPSVPDLTSGLPVAASWPSGHTTAAVAIYGGLAVLVIVYSRSRWRHAVLVLPATLPVLIGLARIYVAAHHPTDVVAGLVLGSLWVLACTRYLLLSSRPSQVRTGRPPTRDGPVTATTAAALRSSRGQALQHRSVSPVRRGPVP